VIVLVSPTQNLTTDRDRIELRAKVVDPAGDLQTVEIRVNDAVVQSRRVAGAEAPGARKGELELAEQLSLKLGNNAIEITAMASQGRRARLMVAVTQEPQRGGIFAVVIGVDKYQHVPALRYAAVDALAFSEFLTGNLGVSKDQMRLLLNEDVTLTNLKTDLGIWLRGKAGPEDTVIIFFAGHGAPDNDSHSSDGDGLAKYLLPVDVHKEKLYATAFAMEEVRTIFDRIRAKRLIFIVDACFSGAAGGRTIELPPKFRGGRGITVSEAFLTRMFQGEGRVILSASGPNELSQENPNLGRGVFTYYLLKALRGEADSNQDGFVSVPEAYAYVSREVPRATDQKQRPVLKGEQSGEIILGKVAKGK